MKKNYKKPQLSSSNRIRFLAPALAAGAALAGGYVVGRVVKSIEVRPDNLSCKSLVKVVHA